LVCTRGKANAKGLRSVGNHVVGQIKDRSCFLPNLDHRLEFLPVHAHELNVTEVHRIAALPTDESVRSPTTNQSIYEPAGAAKELAATTDWQFINEVGLEGMGDVIRIDSVIEIWLLQ
jgi:hypothetical protein